MWHTFRTTKKTFWYLRFLSEFLGPKEIKWWPNVLLYFGRPGAVARSEARPLGMQAASSSFPTSGTFFRGDLVMKNFLRPFSFFRWFKKSSCRLLAKECALSTSKLPRRLAQEQCGYGNWPRPKWPKICWRAVKQKSNQNTLVELEVRCSPVPSHLRSFNQFQKLSQEIWSPVAI